jgi:hypothetical protein
LFCFFRFFLFLLYVRSSNERLSALCSAIPPPRLDRPSRQHLLAFPNDLRALDITIS